MHRLLLAALLTGAALAPPADAATCARFTVGEANSTAYPGGRLPAHGRATGTPCATLRRLARRIHDGTYRVPERATAISPDFGDPFSVPGGWRCRYSVIGASGPSYAMRCRGGELRLRWRTGQLRGS